MITLWLKEPGMAVRCMSMDVRYVAVPWMAKSDACPWMSGHDYVMAQGARKAKRCMPRDGRYISKNREWADDVFI